MSSTARTLVFIVVGLVLVGIGAAVGSTSNSHQSELASQRAQLRTLTSMIHRCDVLA
jgi:hypothetical protein